MRSAVPASPRLRLGDPHGEGVHPLRSHGGADVALVDGQGRDVVLGHPLLAQLPHELPGVVDPETWKTARQPTLASRVSRMVRERSSSLARLWVARMKDAPNLPKLAEHGLVIHAGHRLHLVHHHQSAAPLLEGQASLLPYHGVHQVEEGRAHQGGHVPSRLALGGGDQQDAAVLDWCVSCRWWSGAGPIWLCARLEDA